MWWFRKIKPDEDSQAAVRDSAKQLSEIKKRSRDVQDVTSSLRRMREKNHFAEQIQIILSGESR